MPSPAPALDALPTDGMAVLNWTWQDYAPYFDRLIAQQLTATTVDTWLADWTRIVDLAHEQAVRLQLGSAADTRNDSKRHQLEEFQLHMLPPLMAADQQLKTKLLDSGLEPPGMAVALQKMRAEAERFRSENLPLLARQSELGNEYNYISGSMTVEWDGKEATLAELRSVLQEPDRQRRERAWRLISGRYRQEYAALSRLWTELLDSRTTVAANAGCANYREYVWPLKHRFDYTPADCAEYQRAALAVASPALARRQRCLQERLGLASLRPWDQLADCCGREPLRPFTTAAVLEEKCARIFDQLDPELGQQFGLLRQGLMDLPNRPGKAPGGWCSDLPVVRRPFIFMNAVGLHGDVQTLLHEAGHAFHGFATYSLPYGHQRDSFMEFNEVASMAMELLAAPYLVEERGGFYTPAQAARARIDHLDAMLNIWVMVAIGDAFQHWIYAHPVEARDADRCGEAYLRLWKQYHPALDCSGIEDDIAARWMMTLHFYLVPLYYIEYGLAQLGAVQVWQNAARDPVQTLAQYKTALALGGTVSLPELYAAAGARFAFDEAMFTQCVGAVERLIAELEPVAEG